MFGYLSCSVYNSNSNFVVGTRNFASFRKFSKMNIQNAFFISFLLDVHHVLPELRAIFPLLRQSITFSKIIFFHLLLLNGITQTPILETLRICQSLRKKYLISYDLPQILFLIFTILKELNLLQDLDRSEPLKRTYIQPLNSINSLCNCGRDMESATHFFLHCPFFINERRTHLSTILSLDSKLLDGTDYDLTQTLLFGNTTQTSSNKFKIINASIDYILSSKRFDESLL